MSSSGDLRAAMRQEQYKRGLLKSSKASKGSKGASATARESSSSSRVAPHLPSASKSAEGKDQDATAALPQGFFDDPTAQSKVEEELKKQQELEQVEEESRKAKELAESDLVQAKEEEVKAEVSASAKDTEMEMNQDLEELQVRKIRTYICIWNICSFLDVNRTPGVYQSGW